MVREVEGLAEVVARLKALPAELVGNGGGPVRKALAKAARIVRDEARARAPYDEEGIGKHLRDQIVMKRDPNPRAIDNAAERYIVAVKFKAKKYANTRKNRRKGRVGQKYQNFGDFHYWIPLEFGSSKIPAGKYSFMRPAFEATKDSLSGVVRDELSSAIAQVVRRMQRQ